MPATKRKILSQVAVLLAAALSGFVVAALALGFSGGGHGWNSAFISASAVVTAPAGAICWFARRSRGGKIFAILVTLTNVAVLGFLLRETAGEGTRYVERVWNSVWFLVLPWAALWFGWQMVPIIALLTGARTPEHLEASTTVRANSR